MRSRLTTSLAMSISLAVLLSGPARADDCTDRFAELLVEGNGDVPVTITLRQRFKGAPETVNEFRADGEGNWITEMIDPPSMPWSMVRDDVMYTSSDQGKSWTKLREVDSAADSENARAMLRQDAATVRDTACGEEEIDGVSHEKVEGTYISSMLQGAEVTNVYWVNSDGWISRHTSRVVSSSFEMETEQVMVPGLKAEVPVPE